MFSDNARPACDIDELARLNVKPLGQRRHGRGQRQQGGYGSYFDESSVSSSR